MLMANQNTCCHVLFGLCAIKYLEKRSSLLVISTSYKHLHIIAFFITWFTGLDPGSTLIGSANCHRRVEYFFSISSCGLIPQPRMQFTLLEWVAISCGTAHCIQHWYNLFLRLRHMEG